MSYYRADQETLCVARFVISVAATVADKTRGHRRGRVIGPDGGQWKVAYGRGTVTVMAEDHIKGTVTAGVWVTLGYVDGRLMITAVSPHQGFMS